MRIMLKTLSSEGYREITKAEPVVLEDLVREFKSVLPYTVLLARVNGKYEELTFNVWEMFL